MKNAFIKICMAILIITLFNYCEKNSQPLIVKYNNTNNSVDTTSRDTTTIQPICGDFFPLKIGNYWEFQYLYTDQKNSGDRNEFIGILKWEVINIDSTLKNNIFEIDEKITGKEISYRTINSPGMNPYDTTYVINKHRDTFKIEQSNTEPFQIKINIDRWNRCDWITNYGNRFISIIDDTIRIKNKELEYYFNINYKKSYGPIYISFNGSNYHTGYNETSELIKFESN
jgi:hypothetical protein